MAKLFVGLDVGQERTSICVVDGRCRVLLATSVASTPDAIVSALATYRTRIRRVGHETGAQSAWLYNGLRAAGLSVVRLDAIKIHAALKAQRNKTDRADAHGIATLLARGVDSHVYVKSEEAQRIRLLLLCRRALNRRRLNIVLTQRSILRELGARVEGAELVNWYRGNLTGDLLLAAETLQQSHMALMADVKAIEAVLLKSAKEDAVCRRFMTIPGVGPLTALAFKAAVDDPNRFASSRLVGAHFGLTPRTHQSGKVYKSGRISRRGDSEVRTALYNAALVFLTRTKLEGCDLQDWALRLRSKKSARVAIVACARRLAVIMHRMWINQTDFQPSRKALPCNSGGR